MISWTLAAVVILVVLYMLLFGSNAIAVLRVDKQQTQVLKGSFSPAFLREAERILQGSQGKVSVEPEHNYMVLKFKGDFTERQKQTLINLFPQDNYRSACSAFKTYR